MDIRSKLADLKKFDLPIDEFVVVSSGALAIRGIREAKDLDIIVTDRLWNELAERYPVTKNDWDVERLNLDPDIEILNPTQSIFGNSKIVPFREIFDEADTFAGIRFMNLDHLMRIKAKLGREIDVQDIDLIDTYLNEQGAIKNLGSEGYEKIWIYDAPPQEVNDEHKHDYDTKLRILKGEIRIKLLDGGIIKDFRLKTSDEMKIPRNHLHSAKVGAEGCRYIVAEKH